jgi:hypothetical protein
MSFDILNNVYTKKDDKMQRWGVEPRMHGIAENDREALQLSQLATSNNGDRLYLSSILRSNTKISNKIRIFLLGYYTFRWCSGNPITGR